MLDAESEDRMPERETMAEACYAAVKAAWAAFRLRVADPSPPAELGEEAVSTLSFDASEGDALAMFEMGLLTLAGCAVEQDVDLGLIWLTEAAELGHAEALHQLGELHLRGDLAPASLAEAVKWFRLAAEQGFGDAAAQLDACLERMGELRKAADAGDPAAQYQVGTLTWLGQLFHHDEAKAVDWLRASAAQGHPEARARLADWLEAFPALRARAEAGDPEAQLAWARLLLAGLQVRQDIPTGVAWLERAARAGQPEACEFLGIATTWEEADGLLARLRAAAAAGEPWAVEALAHSPLHHEGG
jgi:TPR repeat protein